MATVSSEALPSARARTWPALAAGAGLFVLDGFVMGQGLLSAVAMLAVLGWLLPKTWLYACIGRDTSGLRVLCVALFVAACAALVAINANNALARDRADGIVAAVEAYRAVNGRYPPSLEALVPAYLEAVPRAKYALGHARFDYALSGRGATLAWAEVPPLGRTVYDFAARRWR